MRQLALTGVVLGAALAAAAAGKAYTAKGLQTGAPGMNTYADKGPEDVTVLPRPYQGAPPLIPHSVADLKVTREKNDCLECHLEGAEVAEGHKATKIPASHFTNPYTNETRTDRPVGTRYNCLQCHAPQTVGATPPVPQMPRE